jgi:hypothetical protein
VENVFIVTYGRSGSTLLQGLLNQIPRTLIRGENHLFLEPLGKSYRLLCNCHFQSSGGTETTSPWFGSQELSPVSFLEKVRILVEDQLIGNHNPNEVDRLGFKEIQYIGLDRPQLFDHLDFLRLLFPTHKFIFHTRNHEKVAKSGWWAKKDPSQVIENLTNFENLLSEYSEKINPKFILHTQYENIVDDIDGFGEQIANFFQTEVSKDSLKWALSQKHSLDSEEVA